MTFDWTTLIAPSLTVIGFVVAITVNYYSVQRDIDRRFETLTAEVVARFSALDLRLAQVFEGDIRELRGRLVAVEEVQKAIIKDVVDRSHDLGAKVAMLMLEVDRLKRPKGVEMPLSG